MRFEWVLGLSIAVHLVLMIVISSSMDMLDNEDVPIKARVNIRYEFTKKKQKPIKKPVLKNKPAKKNLTLKPIEPVPETKKPVLKSTKERVQPKLTKPSISKNELPKLKKKLPKIQSGAIASPKPIVVPKKELKLEPLAKKPEKQKLRLPSPKKPDLEVLKGPVKKALVSPVEITEKIPFIEKKPIPPSEITSKKSMLKPSQKELELKQMSMPEVGKLAVPKLKLSKPVLKKIEIPSQVMKAQPKIPKKPEISITRPRLQSPSLKKDMPQQALIPLPEPELKASQLPQIELKSPTGEAPILPEAPLLEPDSLPTSLTQPILKTPLPEPEAKIPMLEQKIQATPILKPEPLENPQIRTSEPMLVPEAESKPFVPMLELKEVSEPEVPSEIEFNRKLKLSKKIRQAEQEFNQHIQTMVQPKLAMFDPGLYVRIELEIGVSGKIIRYKILEASPSNAFNQAAQLAVRNVNLNPLPEALAENPPYIVPIKIIPQLQ